MSSFQDKLQLVSDEAMMTSFQVVESQFLDALLARAHALHDMDNSSLDNPLRREHVNDYEYYAKEVAEVGLLRNELLKELIRRGMEPSYRYPIV